MNLLADSSVFENGNQLAHNSRGEVYGVDEEDDNEVEKKRDEEGKGPL